MVELLVRAGIAHDHLVLDGPAADAGLSFSARRSLAGAGLEPWVEEITAPVGQSVVAVEATGRGEGLLVPFPGNESAVPNGPEDFPEGGSVLHVVVPDRIGVVAGEELGPGGVTLGGVVELGEAQTVLGQLVEVGGLDFTAVAADVGVAHVIHHDEYEVGPGTVGSGVSEE